MTDEGTTAAEGTAAEKEPTRLEKAKKTYGLVSDILTPTRLLAAAGALIVLIVGLIGGWDKVAAVETELPVATPSVALAAEPFEIAVNGARVADELKPIAFPTDGLRYLFVTADVTLTGDEPVGAGVLGEALAIDAKGVRASEISLGTASIYRLGDGLSQRMLQPGVPVPVVFVWEQHTDEAAPEQLTITIRQHTWAKSTMGDFSYWQQPSAVAELTLPVEAVKPA